MTSARVKWIEARLTEAFDLAPSVAADFLSRRDVATEVTGLLDGTGPSCLHVYYQARDVRGEVRHRCSGRCVVSVLPPVHNG
jgi:hypothetical protein